eukprot:TRINITY_DN38978_c0_g1_i1.p1 TRINITY_DN38978_c0_g1~~TRINITY_DN38978_c0_g1_i1.p1  ORF type:complete len:257 (+),score=30.58 TRINITY_DN38978_c0_g1_i1:70-840(+)
MGQALGIVSAAPQCAEIELKDKRIVKIRYSPNAGLGFTPWPGSFALANFLDENSEKLELSEKRVLELGSGSCSVSGITAGLLCKQVTLTDRLEVLQPLDECIRFSYEGVTPKPDVTPKVLDWKDLEFTESCFKAGQADIILLSDVVYFPQLRTPLIHTLLALCTTSTHILWANCDKYPQFTPDLPTFLERLEKYFDITLEQERSQFGCGGPSQVPDGRVFVRSLRLRQTEVGLAQRELEIARAGGPLESCVKRCMF